MDQETEALLRQHKRLDAVHTNLQPDQCACASGGTVVMKPANITGSTSACCGAMEQRNGSCMICTSCGNTSACG